MRRNNHYSVCIFNTSWKPSNGNFETRCNKMGYILHCCCTSLFQVRNSLCQTDRHSQRERNDENSPKTTRISESDTFTCTSADFFLGDGSRIESESCRQFSSVDSSIVKGPISLRNSRAWNFGRLLNVREYESDAKIQPNRRLLHLWNRSSEKKVVF